jgi:hypothetical protein
LDVKACGRWIIVHCLFPSITFLQLILDLGDAEGLMTGLMVRLSVVEASDRRGLFFRLCSRTPYP